MTTVTWKEKRDPVYTEYGYIAGYDTIEEKSATVPNEEVDDVICNLDGEYCFEIKTQKND